MNCPACQTPIPRGTPAAIGESAASEVEVTLTCPRCKVELYAFTPAAQWARQDHVQQLIKQHRQKTNKRNKP